MTAPGAQRRKLGQRFEVRLGRQERAQIGRLARDAGCSRAAIIRAAIALAVESGAEELRARVRDLPGEAETRARRRAMADMRERGMSYAAIGRAFGGVSASTVRQAVLAHRAERPAPEEGQPPRLRVVGGESR